MVHFLREETQKVKAIQRFTNSNSYKSANGYFQKANLSSSNYKDLLFEIFHYGIAKIILFIIFVNLLIAKSILSTWIFEFDEVQSLLNNI